MAKEEVDVKGTRKLDGAGHMQTWAEANAHKPTNSMRRGTRNKVK
jgi:hypothetical protein